MSGIALNDLFQHNDAIPSDELDWVPVTWIRYQSAGDTFDRFGAWYSPSTRLFWWAARSGCSCCTSFEYAITSVEDFTSGTKDDLQQAILDYRSPERDFDASLTANARAEVRSFRPPRPKPAAANAERDARIVRLIAESRTTQGYSEGDLRSLVRNLGDALRELHEATR